VTGAARNIARGELLRGEDAHRFLTGPWQRLYADDCGATPFQSGPWYLSWLGTVGAAEAVEPLVACLEHPGGRLAMALQRRADGTVEPLTAPWPDYAGPAGAGAADPEACRELFDSLVAHVPRSATIRLDEFAATGAAARALSAAAGWSGTVSSKTALIALPGRFAQLPTSGEHARKLRRLAASGQVTVRHSATRTDLISALDRLVDLHLRQWARRPDVVAPFTDPVVLACYRTQAATMDPHEMIVSELLLDGRTIAAYLGYASERTYYAYRPALDLANYRVSPGHLLLLIMLRDFGADRDVFDLTRGEYGYKHAYADTWQDNLAFSRSGAAQDPA
jgi:CelD/BcsL family acetyltransferase involved in cellulose biosynthesis